MKKLLYLSSLVFLAACAGNHTNFTVEGKFGTLSAPAKIYLIYDAGEQMVDSAIFDNGKFRLRGFTEGPARARLAVDYTGESGMQHAIDHGRVLPLFIEKGRTVVNSPDSLHHASIENSPINDQFKAFTEAIGGSMSDLSLALQRKYMEATPEEKRDPAFVPGLNDWFHEQIRLRDEREIEFARNNPSSFFSVIGLSDASVMDMDPERIEPIFLAIDEKMRNTAEGKALAGRIAAAQATRIGGVAPDFTQNTPDGRAVSLSDFRGKYLLLDFWASWCGPCRHENCTVVVKAYAKYKDRGFEVLGVSLDDQNSKKAWMQAIAADSLTWANVSDLKGMDNEAAKLYGIQAVPQTFILDPRGVIVAKNLRGEKLFEFLDGVLKE